MCQKLAKDARWRAAHPGHYRGTRAEREARAQARAQMADPSAAAPAAGDQRIMAAMLKDDPNWAEIAALRARADAQDKEIAALKVTQPLSSGWEEITRLNGGVTLPAHPTGPEHRHSEGKFAGQVCYCDEPESPAPAQWGRMGPPASSASAGGSVT